MFVLAFLFMCIMLDWSEQNRFWLYFVRFCSVLSTTNSKIHKKIKWISVDFEKVYNFFLDLEKNSFLSAKSISILLCLCTSSVMVFEEGKNDWFFEAKNKHISVLPLRSVASLFTYWKGKKIKLNRQRCFSLILIRLSFD